MQFNLNYTIIELIDYNHALQLEWESSQCSQNEKVVPTTAKLAYENICIFFLHFDEVISEN